MRTATMEIGIPSFRGCAYQASGGVWSAKESLHCNIDRGNCFKMSHGGPANRPVISRRGFLRCCSALGAVAMLPFPLHAATSPPDVYPFEEVPSSKSGIRWVHTAGKSPQKHLP